MSTAPTSAPAADGAAVLDDLAWRGLLAQTTDEAALRRDLAAGPVHRGHRTMVPRREALILLAALNHPWLLHDHLEELASLEFRHADAERLKAALIDIAAHNAGHAAALDPAALKAELAARDFAAVMDRIAGAITTPAVWGSGPEAAPDDVLVTWQQLVALHRQWHSGHSPCRCGSSC